jgi:hypothetical protein
MTRASQAKKDAMVDLALKKPNHHQSQVHSCRLYLRRGTAEACPRNSDPKRKVVSSGSSSANLVTSKISTWATEIGDKCPKSEVEGSGEAHL